MTAPGDLLTPLWSAPAAPAWTPLQWETVLSQARQTRLSGRLAVRFETMGWMAGVPAAPRRHLESAARMADRLRRDVRHEVDQVAAALRGVDTPVVLLKGAAYVAADLPPARGRLFSDVDILVARERLADVEAALLAGGWYPEKLTPYDERYYRKWMHELPPMQHVHRHTALDVHHTITPPTSRFAIDGAPLLADCRAIPGAPRLSMLAPPDMLLHSAVHLMQEGEFSGGLRDLLDLDDLLRHHGAEPGFWTALAQRARELGVERPVGQALAQLQRLFGTQVPAAEKDAFDAAMAGSLQPTLTGSLVARAIAADPPQGPPLATSLARWLLYVRSHWLRMPWYRIAPHLAWKAWSRALARLKPAAADAPA